MTDRRLAWVFPALLIASLGGSDPASPDSRPWAFRPVSRPEVPRYPALANPIDRFLQKRIEAMKLKPAGRAGKATMVRRVTFDLIGLPPTPDEVAAFVADERPDAYERLVDLLLASPHYGERWGRHWLDLVRYAETHGYERDDPKPNAWKYRDWVVSALNRDLPYDRFLVEQLAGDEVPDASNESRTATGMYRLGPIDDEPADPVMDRFDQLDDMLKTVGSSMLGLTIHCARCHDHKFDPIKQSDYYRMLSFLTPSRRYVRGEEASISVVLASDSERNRVATIDAALTRQIEAQNRRIEALREPHRKAVAGMPGDQTALADARMTASEKALTSEIQRSVLLLERFRPAGLPLALGLTDAGPSAEPTHIMIRGDAHRPGRAVEPGFLSAIDDGPVAIESRDSIRSTGRRLALARWITRPDNPLTARVIVNRLWQGHFGRGIVATPSDFGMMGEEPTNPELLDWLAGELIARGWSLKAMHRLMVTTEAYQRSGDWDDASSESDPNNDFAWRRPVRRLEAEPIRDAILSVSGDLNPALGGPSIMPEIEKSVLAGQSRPGLGWEASPRDQTGRRSIYVKVKRTLAVPELEAMDAAENNEPCARRFVTTTAPQALTLLNGGFVHQQAGKFADRLLREAGGNRASHVRRAFALAFSREPTEDEVRASLDFLVSQSARIQNRAKVETRGEPDREALRAFALVLLNSNEFLSVD